MNKRQWKKFIKELKEAQKDPKFRKEVDEFIAITTGRKKPKKKRKKHRIHGKRISEKEEQKKFKKLGLKLLCPCKGEPIDKCTCKDCLAYGRKYHSQMAPKPMDAYAWYVTRKKSHKLMRLYERR